MAHTTSSLLSARSRSDLAGEAQSRAAIGSGGGRRRVRRACSRSIRRWRTKHTHDLRDRRASAAAAAAADAAEEDKPDSKPPVEIEVEYVPEEPDLADGLLADFKSMFEKFTWLKDPMFPWLEYVPRRTRAISSPRKFICVLEAYTMGGGFGGLYTALRLESLVWPGNNKPQDVDLSSSCSLGRSGTVKDFKWLNHAYIVLSNGGLLSHGSLGEGLKDVMENVNAGISWFFQIKRALMTTFRF